MSLTTSPELFINMRAIPTSDSAEWHPFFQEELKKIKYGITINGVYIHGWLYWHLNHWNILLDRLDPNNPADIIRVKKNPDFRDNEWLIAEYIKKAEEQKKGLILFGTRRFAKTEFESSWIGRGATIYEGSQNVISSTNEGDIKVIAASVDRGLSSLHPYFKFDRLLDDWRKEVSLGIKEKNGKRIEWSKILIRNLDEGNNTEAIAGTTPKTLVIDEIGKTEKIIEAVEAAKPGFTSPYGWRCVPILTGTGGTFIPNSDAEKMFNDPESYGFLGVEIPGRSKKFGLFVPGTYRMEAKVQTKFGTYLNKKGIYVPENSELNTIDFYESDVEKATKIIQEEIANAEKAQDPKASLKARMYFPLEPEDCFLSDEINEFPIEAIKQHIAYLDNQDKVGDAVELYRDAENKVKFTFSTKLRQITDFPVTGATIKDAPVMIYEPPVENPPALLYIAGGDPYNQNTSSSSPSLGTVYVYKRLYDPLNGTFQNQIVASYAGRPDKMREWHEIVEMLLELYNATLMIENAGTNFIEYMSTRNKAHYLADGYNLLREITPTTSIQNKPKGLPPTIKVIEHCMALLYDYCKEELIGVDEKGNPMKKLGVTRIKDKMLLIEMLNYSSTVNVDRIVAFRHALAYDSHLQKISPLVRYSEHTQEEPQHKIIKSPFNTRVATAFPDLHSSPFKHF
jgi:hypothetical protein